MTFWGGHYLDKTVKHLPIGLSAEPIFQTHFRTQTKAAVELPPMQDSLLPHGDGDLRHLRLLHGRPDSEDDIGAGKERHQILRRRLRGRVQDHHQGGHRHARVHEERRAGQRHAQGLLRDIGR